MCWVVELMNMFCHRNIRHWKDYWVYDHEKVKFRRLVACYWTFSWTVKGPSTQTKQNKKIIISAPSGYKPTSRFSCLGSGADVSLVTLSVNGNERKTCRGIRKSWPPTLTCPVLHSSFASRLVEFLVCKSALQLSTNCLVLRFSRKKRTLAMGEFSQEIRLVESLPLYSR